MNPTANLVYHLPDRGQAARPPLGNGLGAGGSSGSNSRNHRPDKPWAFANPRLDGRKTQGVTRRVYGSNRRRISSLAIPPSARARARERSISARNSGLVLKATVSMSAFSMGTRAATGWPWLVTTRGPLLISN